jgi:hypothetical protein
MYYRFIYSYFRPEKLLVCILTAAAQYLIKYGSSVVGYALMALPVFFPMEGDAAQRTVRFRLLIYCIAKFDEFVSFHACCAFVLGIMTRSSSRQFVSVTFVLMFPRKLPLSLFALFDFSARSDLSASLCSLSSFSFSFLQVGDNTRDFVRNRQLLMDLAGAVGTLLQTVNKVATLAGSTSRVGEVLDSVNEIQVRVCARVCLSDDQAITAEHKIICFAMTIAFLPQNFSMFGPIISYFARAVF